MNEKIVELLAARGKFRTIIEKELLQNERRQEIEDKEIHKYEDMINHIETLSERPEWQSLLKVADRVYLPGTIKHTGEYVVEMTAHPNPLKLLYTSEQTTNHLQKKLSEHKHILKLLEDHHKQLTERAEVLCSREDVPVDSHLPSKIVSDKGVAMRVGQFYEILEYEET